MRKRNVMLSAVLGCVLSAVAWNLAHGQDAPPPPPGDDMGGPPPGDDMGGPPPGGDQGAPPEFDQGGPVSSSSGQGGQQPSSDSNPQKTQQSPLDQMKATLGATDDEWKVLKPLLEKVMKLLRETGAQGPMGFGAGGPGRFRGDPNAASRQPTSEVAKAIQALQTILGNADATADEIMATLNALREAREKVAQELAKARASLLEVVTPRQEAQLVAMGILD